MANAIFMANRLHSLFHRDVKRKCCTFY